MKEPYFTWDEDSGTAMCIISFKNKTFFGMATCAPEDADMKSEKTGFYIAEQRAWIELLRFVRDETVAQYKILKTLWHSLRGKDFNPNSYESKMIKRKLKLAYEDMTMSRQELKEAQDELRDYLQRKEKFYQRIREIRMDKNN